MSTPVSDSSPVLFGVGFDTSRYGHHVTFLREDLQPACPPCAVAESREGYNQLLHTFHELRQRAAQVHFHIRLDAAGQYAANLEAFLRTLPFPKTITVGEPARNHNYRKALFPKRKADPVESLCAARYALVEKPKATPGMSAAHAELREIVQRLEGQSRQSTRLTNQLHNLLARVFPELALVVADLQASWVLQLLDKYPTPGQRARARRTSLTAVPFLTEDKATSLQVAAASTVASFTGAPAATLVRQLVTQLRHSLRAEIDLKTLMNTAYVQLPQPNQIDSIPGIGTATAAILTAKMVTIDRFASADQVVGFFGIFPEEEASGIRKDGSAKPGRHLHMSRKGNDLARKYLWNAAKSASLYNPAVRALFQRLRARGVRGDVALGHSMRKLLHLVFAVWKTGQPFDPEHYPWQQSRPATATGNEQTADPKPGASLGSSASTARADDKVLAVPHISAALPAPAGSIDFAALRAQVSMEQILARLGWLSHGKGSGVQRRGPCPIHAPQAPRNRSFSVHLDKQVFQCFHPPCGAHGNVLDLWAAVHRLPLYEAARHLAQTFHIDLTSVHGPEKRNP
jgi:transposase